MNLLRVPNPAAVSLVSLAMPLVGGTRRRNEPREVHWQILKCIFRVGDSDMRNWGSTVAGGDRSRVGLVWSQVELV